MIEPPIPIYRDIDCFYLTYNDNFSRGLGKVFRVSSIFKPEPAIVFYGFGSA